MIQATATMENPVRVPMPGDEGHAARGALYGVLSNLFAARPGAELLSRIATADTLIETSADTPLAQAWRALCAAAAAVDPAQAGEEFDALFVSPGLPAVSPYASSYMAGRERGQLLAELRGHLARIGYARAIDSSEYEDHFSALCDVMRGLIGEEAAAAEDFGRQQAFFRAYLAPWHSRLFEAVLRTGEHPFYRSVARFADAFLTHETEYFELA